MPSESAAATGSLNDARMGHTACRLLNGRILVTGGNDGLGHVLASAEIYQ